MNEPTPDFKSGFVAILGRPNAGKSTLLNALIGNKISIVSPIPQTTRHQIKGILNLEGAQIVFVDTPGMHSFRDSLSAHLNTVARRALEGTDLILYVTDVSRPVGLEEKRLVRLLRAQEAKVIMVLNKMDLSQKYFNAYIDCWKQAQGTGKDALLYFMPLSAKYGKNIDKLLSAIRENLPLGEPYYDEQTLTDFPLFFRVADIIREKLFMRLRAELPHSLAVEVQEVSDKKRVRYVRAAIYVIRESQKKIVIGQKGAVLKDIGSSARVDLEAMCGKKVFLDIRVTVIKDWQEKPRILKELGYWWA